MNYVITRVDTCLTEKSPPTFTFKGRGGGALPPFQLHPGAGLCQQLQNTVNTSVFSSSSLQLKQCNLQCFLWLSGQKHCKSQWFLKCLGFKNGRKIAKNLERFCRKVLFRRTYTGFCTFLPQNPVYWDGFMYASKWPQNTVNTINTSSSRASRRRKFPKE